MTALPDVAWTHLAVALGTGLLIGLERERRKGTGASRSPAGIRTHALVSLLGALAAGLGTWPLAASVVGVSLLAVASHLRNRSDDPGLTSETALLVTLLLGAWAMQAPAWAAAVAVVVAVLLAARDPMHQFIHTWLTEQELHDLLVLAVGTLLVLPLMPDQPIDPWGALKPRALWLVLILVMSIAAAGHVALRVLGNRWGLPLIGLSGGFVSSTATIGAMGTRARNHPAQAQAAVAGAVLSTVGTVVQMALLLAVTSLPTLRAMALPLLGAGGVALAFGGWLTWRSVRSRGEAVADLGQAFSFKAALGMAAVLATVSLASAALSRAYGQAGLAAGAALAGLADTHAPAVSVAALVASDAIGAGAAPWPILLALTTNTLSKCVAAMSAGGRPFAQQVVPGLLLILAAAWGGWWPSA
jgi:uncharacterized membrane protein (DUF4010 family)